MYLFAEILISIVLAFVVGAFFYYLFKYSGPWGSFWTFIIILVLAGIAASAWIEPVGPVIYDVAWLPILAVVILFALLLAAASPPRQSTKYPERENIPETTEEELPVLAISTIFWIFLVVLMVAAIVGLFR